MNVRLLATACLVAVLAACDTPSTRTATEPAPELDRQARMLLENGQPREAAREYLRLAADAKAGAARGYILDAAAALIEADELQQATRLLDESLPSRLDRDHATRRRILRGEVALAERAPAQALQLVPPDLLTGVPPALAAHGHALRARAYEAVGNPIESARERVLLELLLTDPAEIAANRGRLWDTVSRVDPGLLSSARLPPPDTLGGWLELASITSESLMDPAALDKRVQAWRGRFPGHPANATVVPELLQGAKHLAAAPNVVALLLPLAGDFQQAANAVRDGFLAAWFTDDGNPDRPLVIVRDTSGGDLWQTYNAAVEDGAEFVVGPLQRQMVATLRGAPSLPVPTLALNYAPPAEDGASGAPTEGLYQFALSPEDEARVVARRAWFDGHGQVAVITPEGVWGERVAAAFVEIWDELGGVVVARRTYADDANDMSNQVKSLLAVDESEQRARALTRIIGGSPKREARRRQDLDFIFMAAFPGQARQLRPQFKFHHAANVPVYATSHVYSGIPDPAADRDVDGIVFGDMPWVLFPTDGLRAQVGDAWGDGLPGFVRLYAFGADAYTLISRVGRLRAHRFAELPGVTGGLSVGESNRVRRRLTWAAFKGGVPRPLVEAE